jgi:hypothetical protein
MNQTKMNHDSRRTSCVDKVSAQRYLYDVFQQKLPTDDNDEGRHDTHLQECAEYCNGEQ